MNDADTYVTLPEQYPRGYYPATGYYFIPYGGLEVGNWQNISLYAELSTLDYHTEMIFRGKNKIPVEELVSWGFGVRLYLK